MLFIQHMEVFGYSINAIIVLFHKFAFDYHFVFYSKFIFKIKL